MKVNVLEESMINIYISMTKTELKDLFLEVTALKATHDYDMENIFIFIDNIKENSKGINL